MDQDDDDFISTNVTENDEDSDIREIEIVEVSPEESNNTEQWYPDNKSGMAAEDKLDVVDVKHEYIPELEEPYVVKDANDQYLKEEDFDLSEDDSIGTASDSSQETFQLEELGTIKMYVSDAHYTSVEFRRE